MSDKQSSDKANKGLGTSVKSVTAKVESAGSTAPSSNKTSGTSQSDKRGKQGE